jgi:MFS transporter, AAHS family, 4-hydroxybenzoate transporter
MNSDNMATSVAGTAASSAAGSRPLSPFQIVTFLLCASVAMIDGFDTQAIALAAPGIAAAWGVQPAAFGPVFAAGLLGALVGAVVFGVAADRYGRKPCLLVAVALFGAVTLATPFATSLESLAAIRFITGIGLGGALPGVISITSEFAPVERRATIVSLMFCGFPLGAVLGGVLAAQLMPSLGWSVLFYIGGIAPLVLLPVIAAYVPESIRFLALRGDEPAVAKILRRMNLEEGWNAEQASTTGQPRSASITALFSRDKALGTLILTMTFLLSLMLAYFLVSWLPLLAQQAGVGIQNAVLGVATLNLGAIVGCLIIGRLADRHGPAVPIGLGYTGGAVAIALIGQSAHSEALLLAVCFVAGALSIGAQMCVVALGAIFYETSVRATGVGWLMGTGRIGAILGPMIGGVLMAKGVSVSGLFWVGGSVSLIAAMGVFAMGWFVLRKPSSMPA